MGKHSNCTRQDISDAWYISDTAICRIRPLKAVYVEAFSRVHSLGRFAIRDNRRIIGVGIIVDVLK